MDIRSEKFKFSLILLVIIILGFCARAYNLNFPAIGYHGGKEHEYLSMAQEMKRTGDYVTRRIYFYHPFDQVPQMRIYPQPPLISYQILLMWKYLGENLWGPRLINILFGILSILVLYSIAKILFKEKISALCSAFLLSILPLAVFFSRNIQTESPAFFFLILGNLFYVRFASSLKKYNLFLGGLVFTIAWVYKFSYLIGVLPLLVFFPYKTVFKDRKQILSTVMAFIIPYILIPMGIIMLKRIGQWEFEELARISLFEIFTPAYWSENAKTLWWYTKGENYTMTYVITAFLGMIIPFFRKKHLLERFIIGWTITIVPYCMAFSDFIDQHNYYQMPFLGLVCISSVYSMSYIAEKIKLLLKADLPKKYITLFLVVVSIAIAGKPIYDSIFRMYSTVFLGVDVAGESLKEFTEPESRIFLRTHSQGWGISRYARRYVGWTDDLKEFKNREEQFKINYICFYPGEYGLALSKTSPDLFKHIQENYHMKEVGLTEEPSKIFYLILERGKGSDPESFLQSFSGAKQLRTIYRVAGEYVFFYSIRPPEEFEDEEIISENSSN